MADENEIKDYTAIDIDEFLVAKGSVLRDYEQKDALAVDQMFEGVPGGNIIFGGMQIRKKEYADTTTAGVWIGVDSDGIGKINIGAGNNSLLWNGSQLVVSGEIIALSGTIGGWTIGATTLTGGGVTLDSSGIVEGGIVRTSSSGQRVQMLDSTNTMQILDSGGTVRAESYSNGWEFNTTGGSTAGRIFIESSFNNLQIQAVASDLFLTSIDDIAFAPGNGSVSMFIDGSTDDVVVSSGDVDIVTGDLIIGNTRIQSGGSWTLTLPSTNGSNGEFLQTDGSGNTSWATVSGGANTSLSNLSTTSINQDLNPGSSVLDIGQSGNAWDRLYIDDIYLTNGDGTINYSGNVALDFYASRIELGSSYTDLSPASFASANFGLTNRWNDGRFSTLDVSSTIDAGSLRFSTGEDITGNGSDIEYDADTDHVFYINSTLEAIIDTNIFTEGDLLAAGSKPFLINHPDGSDRMLRYTAQESPEVLLRHRGRETTDGSGTVVITLPEHFRLVTDPAGLVTVNLTPHNESIVYINGTPANGQITVNSQVPKTTFDYEVIAVRAGYLNAEVEISAKSKNIKDKELFTRMQTLPQKTQQKKAAKAVAKIKREAQLASQELRKNSSALIKQ